MVVATHQRTTLRTYARMYFATRSFESYGRKDGIPEPKRRQFPNRTEQNSPTGNPSIHPSIHPSNHPSNRPTNQEQDGMRRICAPPQTFFVHSGSTYSFRKISLSISISCSQVFPTNEYMNRSFVRATTLPQKVVRQAKDAQEKLNANDFRPDVFYTIPTRMTDASTQLFAHR